MRLGLVTRMVTLLAAAIFAPVYTESNHAVRPNVDRIEPQAAKPGGLVTAFGVNLDRSRVFDLILTNSERTALTRIIEQTDVSIRFQVPQSLAPGQYQILLALAGRWNPETVEQQVSLTVLEEWH